MTYLFEPTALGALQLNNRAIMAPMSRNRASDTGLATALMAEYYQQRATAGLIISEGIQPSQVGQGFMNSPGLHTEAQVNAWRQVTTAVHKRGGKIIAQLMHSGRIGHPDLYPSRHQSIAPSAIRAAGYAHTPSGHQDFPVPRAMDAHDIEVVVEEFVSAAQNALEAGFDGVQIHTGNGFLLHQFLSEHTNHREDDYGGSAANRARFALQVINRVCDAIGADKTAIRLSPGNPYNDMQEADIPATYSALIDGLPALAFIEIMEAGNRDVTELIRKQWRGKLVLNPHATADSGPVSGEIAEQVLASGLADAVAFGALFLANPDLVARLQMGEALNALDPKTLYGGDHKGYTDYPFIDTKDDATAGARYQALG